MSTLQLTVTQGQLKKSSEIFGKMENYVLVKLTANGKETEYKSTIVEGAKDKPITWNYTFNLPIPRQAQRDARLDVWVKDEDMTSDDVNGWGCVNVDRCLMFGPGRNSYKLTLHGEKKKDHTGDLYFTTQYV